MCLKRSSFDLALTHHHVLLCFTPFLSSPPGSRSPHSGLGAAMGPSCRGFCREVFGMGTGGTEWLLSTPTPSPTLLWWVIQCSVWLRRGKKHLFFYETAALYEGSGPVFRKDTSKSCRWKGSQARQESVSPGFVKRTEGQISHDEMPHWPAVVRVVQMCLARQPSISTAKGLKKVCKRHWRHVAGSWERPSAQVWVKATASDHLPVSKAQSFQEAWCEVKGGWGTTITKQQDSLS